MKYTNGKRIAVIPNHDTVARGTLKSILIQAGIELEEFLELLK
jgi:predicted RNA binding protein YcfA (HicA-like mRNA interferase family)